MIAAVIVTFSGDAAMLDACIASVRAGGGVDRIIVVDNGGQAVVDSGVELIRPQHNLGFGGGANAGFRRAAELGASYVALLNDDVEVDPGWLAPLLAALGSDERLGAVQPKLLLAGSGPARVNSVGVTIGPDGAGSDVGFGETDGPEFESDRQIESFTGGAVLFRSSFLAATAGFDDSYFLYYEDIDLARRGTEQGWSYRCVPASVVWHRYSASTSQLGDRARYLQERNRLRFVFRFGDPAMVAHALWLSIRRVRWTPRRVHARALVAGLASAPAALVARRAARHR
ncbi:MAG: glycosyltransferase family 2 protein [Ilumatobacteraceae bacterium]